MEVSKEPNPVPFSTLEVNRESYPEVVPQNKDGYGIREDAAGNHHDATGGFWKRKWVWAIVVVCLVIVGVIVGAVVGTQRAHPCTTCKPIATTTTTSIQTSTPTMTGSATPLTGYVYPTAISLGYPHLEIFAVGKDDNNLETVYWKWRGLNSSDSQLSPTDGSLAWVGGSLATYAKSVAALARGVPYIDIFVTGAGSPGAVYHKSHQLTTPWSGGDPSTWDGRGGGVVTAPSVVSWDVNDLSIFALGVNSDLFQMTWNYVAGWSSWIRLGGNWTNYPPTAVSWGVNRMDIFVVDPDNNQLYHTYWNGSWQPASVFESLGGYCTSRPAAVSWASNRLDIFVRGGDAGLWHLSFNGTWSNWTSISGSTPIQGEPEAISWGANRIDVFAWGVDGSLLHKAFDGSKDVWTPSDGFEVLGSSLGGPPKGVCDAVGSLHVVAFSRFSDLVHLSYNQTVGNWSPEGNFESLGTPPGGI